MTLLDIATKGRSQKDALLKLATAVLVLQDLITEKQDAIREQSIIEITDEGTPTVSGFKDDDYVELLQQQIEVLSNNREELQSIVSEAEAAFAAYGLPAMSMEALNLRIDEARDRAVTIARQVNRLAVRLTE